MDNRALAYILDYYQTCGIEGFCGEVAGAWPAPKPLPPVAVTPARKPLPPPMVVRKPPSPPAVAVAAEPPLPPNTLTLAEKQGRLAALALTVSGCQACALARTRTKTVFGVGNPMASVVFIGEAPGAEEDLAGEPFVGPAGKLLDRILTAARLERQHIYIANTLKCRPPANREPLAEEIHLCRDYLVRQLEIISPQAIFTLGRYAILCLLGLTDSMGKLRGRPYQWRGIPVVASYHPSYYLRTPSRKKAAWEDLWLLEDILAVSDKPPVKTGD